MHLQLQSLLPDPKNQYLVAATSQLQSAYLSLPDPARRYLSTVTSIRHHHLSSTERFISIILLLAITFIPMSRWAGFWSGAGFSPFGSSRATQATDNDSSNAGSAGAPRIGYGKRASPGSQIDNSLILRHGKVNYPLQFPASSISDGSLKIGELRREAAKAIEVHDPSRVRLLFKGKNLKDDSRTCVEEGLRAGSELMCMASEMGGDNSKIPECDGSETEGEDGEPQAGDDQSKKKKNKNRRKKSKKPAVKASGIPSTPPASAASTPKTALDKLNAISSHFHTKLLPLCVLFTSDPPTDPAKREFEHRKLTETIFSDVMLMLDAVETEGDPDARQRRKDLVKETQGVLSGLDAVLKVDQA